MIALPTTVQMLSPQARLSQDRKCLVLVGPKTDDCRAIPLKLPEQEIGFLEGLAQGLDNAKWAELVTEIPPARRLELYALVETLRRQGLVIEQLRDGEEPLLTQMVMSDWYKPHPFDQSAPYCLSRFALLRSKEGGILLESPRSHTRVLLSPAGLAHCTEMLASGVDLGPETGQLTVEIANILVRCGFLVRRNSDGSNAEDSDRSLQDWDFHDLLFHARSRAGRHRDGYGKIRPGDSGFDDDFAATDKYLTFLGDPISLPKPDMEALLREDRSFSQILESRRSWRRTPATPLTFDILAEFLFRSARIRNRENSAAFGSWRPFASGAGLNELDIFLSVVECEGLEPGLYRYDGVNHALERIDANSEALKMLESFSGMERLGVHILIAARFGKLNCRYDSIAYSLILRNAGCLLQTMYLVATALDRAPCAIGAGNADIFAKITGLPYEIQGTVADFVLR